MNDQKIRVGFIGLGIMGKPMCKNLLKANYDLIVLDKNLMIMEEFKALGAKIATSPKEIAEQVDVIITMLPDSPDVHNVILGNNGILEGGSSGLTVIDMSSISPIVCREIAAKLLKNGIHMLDAPVSGGEPKAIEGTISVMVGGDAEIFQRYYSLMKSMAGSVVHVGEIGSWNITKLCNQIIVAINISAISEALILAQKAGVNPEIVFKAIRGGLAGSTVLDAKAPMILERRFEPGFRIKLHIKDLNNVLDTSNNLGISLPITEAVMGMMQALKDEGLQEEDHAGLIKYYEKMTNILVQK